MTRQSRNAGTVQLAVRAVLVALLCLIAAGAVTRAAEIADSVPDAEELEAVGAVIGRIRLERLNVFDLDKPEENNALYRLANRLHVMTRPQVIRQQLLFRSGDPVSARLIDETERLLRRNAYFYDAKIQIERYQDGVADIVVTTRDVWTLVPGLSVSRKGGENRTRFSLSEQNLLGWGTSVRLSYVDDVDRESTSFEVSDRNLGNSWLSMFLRVADNSDGDSQHLVLQQPFYALDTHLSAGINLFANDGETRFYELGDEVAEYRGEKQQATVFYGWSDGLRAGWVRRWRAGITFDEHRFAPTEAQLLPQLLPADRRFTYPWLGFELLEDRFETSSNRDQIDRTEDFFMGLRFAAQLGYASASAGSDRDAVLFNASASRGFGSIQTKALLLSSSLSGRLEDGDLVNALWHIDSRFYNQLTDKTLFYTTLHASFSRALDLDNPLMLGGDSGLRGYPLRYQVGDTRLLLSAEYRYFTDWYPFRLVRVGGAVFADIGRTWGRNPAGGGSLGWLKDVGIGLRFMPTRAGGREVVHLDLAFPLDGDPSIDDVQILLESKRSF